MTAKRWVVTAVAATSFLGGALVTTAFTQAQAPSFVATFSFMKVDPDKAEAYVRFERELWKPVHQERIRTGRMKSWSLYQVEFPHGTDQEYDFVAVNVYNSITDLERGVADVFAKVHPNIPMTAVATRTYAARREVRAEMWRRLDHIE